MTQRLPIYEIEAPLAAAFDRSNRLIIHAPTGSGKSTQVPQMLLTARPQDTGQIVVLQPRRLAARLLARRVAQEWGCALGDDVGYQVRFENHAGPSTRIRYVTEGILLREMLSRPTLDHIGTLIFDEFHERHLYGDVTLAHACSLQQDRPGLRLIVMSATLDHLPLQEYLAPCEVLQAEGRTYPVSMRYLDRRVDFARQPVWETACKAFEQTVRAEPEGHVLIFMPGAYEIQRTAEAIRHSSSSSGMEVLPLHGELPLEAQDAAVATSSHRKVVVATNVAETSITIENVRTIIDSGLARVARFDPRRGINTLMIEKISKASADQRAGRAGRTAPGLCMRLWTEHEQRERPLHDQPEIRRIDLSEVLLTLKATGIDNLETFPWIDPPAPETVRHALELLHDLGALNRQGSLTSIGRAMLKFPVHPRYARMLLAAETYDCKREAALIAALAQGRSILVRKIDKRIEQAREDALGRYAESDFLLLMKAWEHACNNRFRREACAELGIHGQACRQTAALYRQFLPLARADEYQPAAPVESIQRCILAAFSDQLALRRDQGTLRCQLVHGRSAELARESAVREARLFVASDIQEIQHSKRNLTVLLNLATAVNEEWLKELFPEDFNEANEAVYDPTLKRVSVVYRRQFRDLVLEQRPTGEEPDPDQAAALLAQEILAGNLSLNKWDDAIEKWITRVNCLAAWRPDWQIPPINDEARATIIEQICLGAVCRRDLKHRDVRPGVHSWLTPAQRQLIEQEAPERLKLPCGRRSRLRYQEGAAPVLSATIQDLYGLEKTPKIAGRQVPLQVEILAPNRRPVQITEDLASFWSGAYPEIRRQLSKRYPKHEWR